MTSGLHSRTRASGVRATGKVLRCGVRECASGVFLRVARSGELFSPNPVKDQDFTPLFVGERGPSKPGGPACSGVTAQRLFARHDGPEASCSRARGQLIDRPSIVDGLFKQPAGVRHHVGWPAAMR